MMKLKKSLVVFFALALIKHKHNKQDLIFWKKIMTFPEKPKKDISAE